MKTALLLHFVAVITINVLDSFFIIGSVVMSVCAMHAIDYQYVHLAIYYVAMFQKKCLHINGRTRNIMN